MSLRQGALALALVAAISACSDRTPVNTTEDTDSPAFALQQTTSSLLTNIPVTGTLSDGGTFTGLLTITNLAVRDGLLVASGTLTGTATTVGGTISQVTQTFTNIPLALTGTGSCTILTLDLGPLHLDLLGLVVDLSAVHLDITAQQGPGNLLGNLLCAVAHLLDQGGALSHVLGLLNRINLLL